MAPLLSLHAFERLVTVVQYAVPSSMILLGLAYPDFFDAGNDKTMPFWEFGLWILGTHLFGMLYIWFQEWVYFTFPALRTQPDLPKKLKHSKSSNNDSEGLQPGTREYWDTFSGTGGKFLCC